MTGATTSEHGDVVRNIRGWKELVCERFIRLSLSGVELAGDDRIVNAERGGVHVGRVRSGPQRVVRTQLDVRKGGEEYVFMNLQVRGRCKAEQNGRQVVLAPGDISLFDSVSPYVLNFDAPFEQMVVHMPRAWLTRFEGDSGLMAARQLNASSSVGDLLVRTLRTLEATVFALDDQTTCAMANAALLMAVAALAVHRKPNQTSKQHTYDRALAVIERFRCDRHLTPARVAMLVGCSLRYLQGIFSDRMSTIDGSIWQARLRLASEMLARDHQRPVTDIALDCGFASSSHFSSSFRELFKASPTEWRRRGEISPPNPALR